MPTRIASGVFVVAALSVGVGWFAARSLYSQNAEKKAVPARQAPAAEQAGDALDALAWLAGSWVEKGEEPAVEFQCRWTRTGAFLLRAFRVAEADEATMAGLQII